MSQRGPYVTVCILLTLLLRTTVAYAQDRSGTHWYFGQRAGMTFVSGNVDVLADGQLRTNEGCAAVSDPVTGELLFYTDGVTVWNRLHDPMPNGRDLNGDVSTSQSALIVPVPGSSTQYYIFNAAPITSSDLRERCFCLYYSVVDMSLDAGFGEVTTKNVQLWQDITEHVTAAADCRDDGWWVIVRSGITRDFYSFRVERGRIDPVPVKSDASNPTLVVRDVGTMTVSPDGRKLVITSGGGSSQLYSVNPATGQVTDGLSMFPISEQRGSHYGAAFDRDGRYVFVSVAREENNSPTRIYRFDATKQTALDIQATRRLIGEIPGISEWAALQLGPDGKIYVAQPRTPYVGVIATEPGFPDSTVYTDSSLRLTGVCQNGLPNLLHTWTGASSARVAACETPFAQLLTDSGCANSCFEFRDVSFGRIDSWDWTFEGASPSRAFVQHPKNICYPTPGTFQARLIVRNQYGSDTAVGTVVISPRPTVTLQASSDTICDGDSVVLIANGASSYVWRSATAISDSSSTSITVRPRGMAMYTVIGTNANGCADTASITVAVRQFRTPNDVVICRGSSTVLRASGGQTYQWTPATGLDDPTSASPTASPDTSTAYVLTITSGNCSVRDTVVVVVVDTFNVTVSGDSSICRGSSTELRVDAGSTFQWSPARGLSATNISNPIASPDTTTTYTVIVSSVGCIDTATFTIIVTDPPPISAGNDETVCTGGSVTLRVNHTVGASARVVWSPSTGLSRTDTSVVVAQPSQTTTYIVTVSDITGCTSADTVTVSIVDSLFLTTDSLVALCAGDARQVFITTNASTLQWNPTSGISDPTSPSPIVNPDTTTTYIITATQGSCGLSDTITVVVSTLEVNIEGPETMCRGESVDLLVRGGGVRHRWTPSDGLSDPNIANPIASPERTTTYSVTSWDRFGCEARSTYTLNVEPSIVVRLIAPTITAPAGKEDLHIPLVVDVAPSQLPLFIPELLVELTCDVGIFRPLGANGATLAQSTRGDDRVMRLTMRNLNIISPRQTLAEVYGVVLLGRMQFSTLRWINFLADNPDCMVPVSDSGILYVSGCAVRSRPFRLFSTTTVTVTTQPNDNALEVVVRGSQPGTTDIRAVGVDGRVYGEHRIYRPLSSPLPQSGADGVFVEEEENVVHLDMTSASAGMYFVVVTTSTSTEAIPVSWMR